MGMNRIDPGPFQDRWVNGINGCSRPEADAPGDVSTKKKSEGVRKQESCISKTNFGREVGVQ